MSVGQDERDHLLGEGFERDVVGAGDVLPAALAVAQQETWAAAHSQYAAQPTADRPDGAIIETTAPERWAGEPVRVLDLTP
ncbi:MULTISPECIES: hypothetical protein [unclassified Streptomyces]|uniref:hypothetical protein n=1 Tax=unclassified Streptomyces TaxID=2593676 RepID=UPI000F483203|nr:MULTISPECIES: hypothetical protein [unclassified Streptomyces]